MSKPTDLKLALLALPVIGMLLTVFWVGEMSLIQNPMSSLNMVMIFVIVGTASLAAWESSQNGEVADKKAGRYSPTQWFFIISLIWFIGYPAYMIKRKHQGLSSMGLVSILLVFFTSLLMVATTVVIEENRADLREALRPLQDLQNQLER